MTVHSSPSLLLFLLAGCVAAPRPDRASASDAEAISAVLEGLYSPDPARRALARTLLDDLGPAGAPALRGLLTRRTEPPDPFIQELVTSLDARENLLSDAARDQILLRGRRAAPDLWEALLSTESPVLALRALKTLARMEGPARVRSALEALRTWGAAPKWLDQVLALPNAAARLAVAREADGEPTLDRRTRKLTDDATLREFLAEIDQASVLPAGVLVTPVEREPDEK